ncbi:MAG TPA: hypothetical protein VFB58_04735 [Chloroflexota bacterium]|nr:hypothetical protein [Chloroflexota bacterium]
MPENQDDSEYRADNAEETQHLEQPMVCHYFHETVNGCSVLLAKAGVCLQGILFGKNREAVKEN